MCIFQRPKYMSNLKYIIYKIYYIIRKQKILSALNEIEKNGVLSYLLSLPF